MKTIKYCLLFLLGLGMLSSCAYSVYPVSDLNRKYESAMQTVEELTAKSQVHIYLSESEVPGDYELISFVNWHPVIAIPLIAPDGSQRLKKFYKKAVLKAAELGGNAIIVTSIGEFKVINAHDLEPIDVEIKSGAKNDVMGSMTLDTFTDGSINDLDKKKQSKLVDALVKEIENGLKKSKTLEETDVVSSKIEALKDYNDSAAKPSRSLSKKIKGFEKDLDDLVGDIEKKMKKAAKRAETKEKIKSKLKKNPK